MEGEHSLDSANPRPSSVVGEYLALCPRLLLLLVTIAPDGNYPGEMQGDTAMRSLPSKSPPLLSPLPLSLFRLLTFPHLCFH